MRARWDRNRIAAVLIVAAVVAVVAWTWLDAPARNVDHVVAGPVAADSTPGDAAPAPDRAPAGFTQIWDVPAPKSTGPFTVDGLVIAADDRGVSAIDPATGESVWSYHRDIPLCASMISDGRVVTVFRGPAGCGEVTSLDAATGAYHATRRSLSSANVEPVRSNDRVGVRDASLVELWRDDLVRTVEYGRVEAAAEPGLQPHPGCSVIDAATRGRVLAVVNDCPDGHRLVLQEATPDESRSPEITGDVELPGPARVAAIGQLGAAVAVDGHILAFALDGSPGPTWAAPPSTLPATPPSAAAAPAPAPATVTADLPHHMTWFTGTDLVALRPDDLSVDFVVPGALGTGAIVGEELLVPVRGGFARVSWSSGDTVGTVPMARPESRPGDAVVTAVAGDVLVEKRGDRLVGLRPSYAP